MLIYVSQQEYNVQQHYAQSINRVFFVGNILHNGSNDDDDDVVNIFFERRREKKKKTRSKLRERKIAHRLQETRHYCLCATDEKNEQVFGICSIF